MAELSPFLRSVRWPNGVGGVAHWCPACNSAHAYSLTGKNSSGAQWNWVNRPDAIKPTLTPSMNIRINTPDMKEYNKCAGSDICHYFVTDGMIKYGADCTHALKGQAVPLPEWDAEKVRKLNYEWAKDA